MELETLLTFCCSENGSGFVRWSILNETMVYIDFSMSGNNHRTRSPLPPFDLLSPSSESGCSLWFVWWIDTVSWLSGAAGPLSAKGAVVRAARLLRPNRVEYVEMTEEKKNKEEEREKEETRNKVEESKREGRGERREGRWKRSVVIGNQRVRCFSSIF